MATAVLMPKQGQTVESCIIVEWKKRPGDSVAEGEILCEVETDKAVLEVPSPTAGTLLARFFNAGDDVPVLTAIAAIGAAGEDARALRPANASTFVPDVIAAPTPPPTPPPAEKSTSTTLGTDVSTPPPPPTFGISPRARGLAEREAVDTAALQGSGPGGRILERDVQAALSEQPKFSPVAKAMVAAGEFVAPAQGSGPGGRVMARDLTPPAPPAPTPPAVAPMQGGHEDIEEIPVRGVRKVIAERMLASLHTTAQLTMHSSADARTLQQLRKRLKASDPALGLQGVTINDLILFVVTRVLLQHPILNATFGDNLIRQYGTVHLGFAVDTPRGLLVPVIRHAEQMSLRGLAQATKSLAAGAQDGSLAPDDLTGGTFTVTNLGSLGVDSFTPILNPPQVAILGVSSIQIKPVEVDEQLEFIPHIGLSLTINHQVVDGAPGARFLQALGQGLRDLDLLLAI